MGLKGKTIYLNLVGAGGITTSIRTKMVYVKIEDRVGEEFTIECVRLSQACGSVLNMDATIIESCGRELLQDKGVYTKGGQVDLLIVMSMPELHKQLSFQRLQNGSVIMETKFGYCLIGSIHNRQTGNYKNGEYAVNHISIVHEESEEFMFRDQLQAEHAGISKKESFKNEEEVQFEKRIKLDNDVKDNRFQVELPWKYNPDTFKNNRNQAVERDIRLLRQLSKRSEMLVLFQEQIKEMVATEVLRKVDSAYPKRYLPLLAISNLERESSEVRICLDAKCKFE